MAAYGPAERRDTMAPCCWVAAAAAAVVVVMFAAILAAIMLPVFMRAREKARQAACMSNLRDLAMSLHMYAADNDDALPRAATWSDSTQPYHRNPATFVCPSVQPPTQCDYAYNVKLSSVKPKELRNAAEVVLTFESVAGKMNAADEGTSLCKPGRHLGGNSFAFADGHVKWIPDQSQPPTFEPELSTKAKEEQ